MCVVRVGCFLQSCRASSLSSCVPRSSCQTSFGILATAAGPLYLGTSDRTRHASITANNTDWPGSKGHYRVCMMRRLTLMMTSWHLNLWAMLILSSRSSSRLTYTSNTWEVRRRSTSPHLSLRNRPLRSWEQVPSPPTARSPPHKAAMPGNPPYLERCVVGTWWTGVLLLLPGQVRCSCGGCPAPSGRRPGTSSW